MALDTEWAAASETFASPLFDALRGGLESLTAFPEVPELNELAARSPVPPLSARGRRVTFVAPGPQSKGLSVADNRYETRVQLEAAVETRRGNWHDLFNALAWLAWPQTKAALNAVHVRDLQSVVAGRRSVARDLVTLFDEGGAVLASSDAELTSLLRGFRWNELFCVRRPDVEAQMRCYIFGHALFDKARTPYKGMTARALIFPVTPDFFRQPPALQVRALDARVAGWFGDPANLASTQQLAPLPVLGFPGFCAANADPRFYDEAAVFRPGRLRMSRP